LTTGVIGYISTNLDAGSIRILRIEGREWHRSMRGALIKKNRKQKKGRAYSSVGRATGS